MSDASRVGTYPRTALAEYPEYAVAFKDCELITIMKGKKSLLAVVLLVVGVIMVGYFIANKDLVISEHMTLSNPTVYSLSKELEKTEDRVSAIETEFANMKAQAATASNTAAALYAIKK
jgi:hypothetical protein